jgi:putative ABC transport system substrate-binding protein
VTHVGHPITWTCAEKLLTLGLRASGAELAIQRREFITLLGSGTVAWPLAARAQTAMPVIGVLGSGSAEGWAPLTAAFRQGVSETGYTEDRNLAIEYQWAEGHYDRLPEMAADLIHRKVSAIAAFSTPAALAAKAATSAIPIVFTTIGNPVQIGLVASLSRPGGNVTGVTSLNVQVAPKRLELLHELLPAATDMALLVNPNSPTTEAQSKELQAAARTLGLQLHILLASTESDFDTAFSSLGSLRAGGLVIGGDILFAMSSDRLAAMALQHAVPAIYQGGTFAAAGGLMDYGGNFAEPHRLAGTYTGRILKGEKPADLPVQQATKVELIINLKTAKALGVTVPLSLLGRADQVIE